MPFDWLVIGQVMPTNPAHSVRGPRHSVTKGVTPVLSSEEATALLTGTGVSTAVGLRDRAIIAVMETMPRVGLREVQHGALLAALRRVDFHFALLFSESSSSITALASKSSGTAPLPYTGNARGFSSLRSRAHALRQFLFRRLADQRRTAEFLEQLAHRHFSDAGI